MKSFSEAQAKAILAMRLSSLAKLEKERKNLLFDDIADYETLLQSKKLQENEVRRRLEEIIKKYRDGRCTHLTQIEIPKKKRNTRWLRNSLLLFLQILIL